MQRCTHLPLSANGPGGLADADLQALGIPGESEFVAINCREAGRQRIEDWPFFLAFSCFPMAAITHGVYARRGVQGNAADARALSYGEVARRFAATGVNITARAA